MRTIIDFMATYGADRMVKMAASMPMVRRIEENEAGYTVVFVEHGCRWIARKVNGIVSVSC